MKHTVGGLEVTVEYGREPGTVNMGEFVARVKFEVQSSSMKDVFEKAAYQAAILAAGSGVDRVWYTVSDMSASSARRPIEFISGVGVATIVLPKDLS